MAKVISSGSSVAVLFYILVGVFGYACFASTKSGVNQLYNLCNGNILQADFNSSIPIQIGNFSLLFSVMAAAPLCVLPSKDTIEELFYKEKGMTKTQNFLVTFILVTVNCVLALSFDGISTAMTFVGSSINPIIGFILPVVFYWPTIKDKPLFSKDKLLAISTFIFITVVSVLSLIKFFQDQFSKDDEDTYNCY